MHVQTYTNGKHYDKELQLSRSGLHSDSAERSHTGSEGNIIWGQSHFAEPCFLFVCFKVWKNFASLHVSPVSSRQKQLIGILTFSLFRVFEEA